MQNNGVVFKEHFIDNQKFGGAEQKLFQQICSDISNINSPYQFNYLPIHILGSIYERFLGKIVISTAKRVSIEEKPEVRKAGGVYYTPKYIVDYIVANTVGKLIEEKTPKQINGLRFADIACGSGSFLISVYDTLLQYHTKYYNEKLKDKTEIDKRSEDFENVVYQDKQWKLTLKLKQEILLSNIYGVDIDSQAVEVTQLSLFLKMLEDETLKSTQVRQGLMFSKVLPDLTKNIFCGNSIIGTDILKNQLFSFEEEKKLNPLDFTSVFPRIMQKGGFDIIIGNPPYVRPHKMDEIQKRYYWKKYKTFVAKSDLYSIFMEKGLSILNENGLISFIVPQTWTSLESFFKIREKIFLEAQILTLVQLPKKVFKDATVETCLFFFKKQSSNEHNIVTIEKLIPLANCKLP